MSKGIYKHKKGWKHKPETIEKNRQSHIGKHRSEETKRKISETHKRKGTKPPSLKGIKLSKEHREKIRQIMLGKFGKLARNWKGGITDLIKCIRSLDKYKEWRMSVFLRDNFTCQFCGIRSHIGLGESVYLESHHIKSLKEIIKDNKIKNSADAIQCEELWNINNGITLCKKCHNLTKKGNQKQKKRGYFNNIEI